jgi:hypothetical protein
MRSTALFAKPQRTPTRRAGIGAASELLAWGHRKHRRRRACRMGKTAPDAPICRNRRTPAARRFAAGRTPIATPKEP